VGRACLAIAACAACGRIDFDVRSHAAGDARAIDTIDAPDPLAVGLVHYWPLDEPVGAPTATDVVGGAIATLSGPASFVAQGQRGGALASNAGGFAAVTTTPNDLLGVSQITLSAWLKRSAPNRKEQVGQEVSPGSSELSIQAWSDGLVYFCIGITCGTTPAGNDTSWHLATLVFDGTQPTDATKLAGYLDGVPQTLTWMFSLPVATTTPVITGHFDLGAVSDNETQDTGTIDEVRVYTRVLAPAEVTALATGT
jgi:hypothetical protein